MSITTGSRQSVSAVSWRSGSSSSCRVVGDRLGPDVRITVSDDGCGPAPRLDSPGLSAGLGLMATLATSLKVTRAAVGHGTVVTMAFAAADAGITHDRPRRPSDQRAQDARARRQTSAARIEAAWLGALATRARDWTATTRVRPGPPAHRGERLAGPPPTGR